MVGLIVTAAIAFVFLLGYVVGYEHARAKFNDEQRRED